MRLTTSNSISQLNPCGSSPYVTSSLMRGWVCRLQLLLVLVSAVTPMSEPRRTHDLILLSQNRDSHNLEVQVPVFISTWNRVARLYPQALGSLFLASYDSQGYGGGIRPRLHMGHWLIQVKVKVILRLMLYCQSVCLGVKPLKTHDQRFFCN
jgi:hypothetical protein